MRSDRARMTFEVVLGVVLGIGLVIILHLTRQIAVLRRQHTADSQSIRLLQDTLGLKGLQNPLNETTEESSAGSDRSGIVKREATIKRLDHDLAEARNNTDNLQTQLTAANDQIAKLQSSTDERLQKQQADAQAQIADLQKKLDAAIAASDIARERTSVLEADNSQMKTDTAAINARAAEVARIISNLQDIERRRDVYLTSILRRYRDITDELHAMSSILDTSHDPGASACSGAALSRIQTAVTSAEDDMRQMNDLSARSQKLEKQLSKK